MCSDYTAEKREILDLWVVSLAHLGDTKALLENRHLSMSGCDN